MRTEAEYCDSMKVDIKFMWVKVWNSFIVLIKIKLLLVRIINYIVSCVG